MTPYALRSDSRSDFSGTHQLNGGNYTTTGNYLHYTQTQSPDSIVDSYLPELVAYINYYPFGMPMPARTFSSESYRYGFNGKEKDDEIKGDGLSYDFGARLYDNRVGRWLSLDALSSDYPHETNYGYAGQNPIRNVEVDGNWYVEVHLSDNRTMGNEGIAVLKNNAGDVVGIYMVGGRGMGKVVNPLGTNWQARRQATNGDTPTGTWKISHWQRETSSPSTNPKNNRAKFGEYRLWLSNYQGSDGANRDANTIRWHASEYENKYHIDGNLKTTGMLANTAGCARSSLEDMYEAHALTVSLNEPATIFSVENDFSTFGNVQELTSISTMLNDVINAKTTQLNQLVSQGYNAANATAQQKAEYNEVSYYIQWATQTKSSVDARITTLSNQN